MFTPGVTVEHWRLAGLLAREVHYYEELSSCVGQVAFVSAGDRRMPESARIRVLSAPAALARRPRIVKTNQLAGLPIALAAKMLGSRLVARGGYVPSEPWRHRGVLAPSYLIAALREAALCRVAELVLVTTEAAAAYMRTRYALPAARLAVVPNFVEIRRFAIPRVPRIGTVTMIGRLTPEKNLFSSVEAIADLPGARLRLVGDGPLREALRERAGRSGASVEMIGRVPHDHVPRLLAETDVFLIASHFEGHPKALLEAMAAGVPCVVTPSPGLRDLVEDGITGYVATGASGPAIRAAVARALGDPERESVGTRAREAVARTFSLEAVLRAECVAYRRAGLLE